MHTTISRSGYAETLALLLDALERRGLTVFAQVDHAAGAREVGMELRDEVVVLFGNPRAGTPLMQQDPRIGIELPLRMLVWDRGDAVVIGWHDPQELASSYEVAEGVQTLQAMSALLADLAREATGSLS